MLQEWLKKNPLLACSGVMILVLLTAVSNHGSSRVISNVPVKMIKTVQIEPHKANWTFTWDGTFDL